MERKRLDPEDKPVRQRLNEVKERSKKDSESKIVPVTQETLPELDPSVGRNPVIANPKVYNTIIKSLSSGNYLSTACKLAGVSYEAIKNTLDKGKKGDNELYHQFYLDCQLAEAIAEDDLIDTVTKNSIIDWRAAMELLQRRFPERWSKVNNHQVTHKGQINHNMEIKNDLADKVIDSPLLRQQARDFLKSVSEAEIIE